MPRLSVLLLLLMSFRALAAEYLVESASQEDKQAAQDLADEIGAREGVGAVVVRRFERGQGWGYVVQVKGQADLAAAQKLAIGLGTVGGPARIYDTSQTPRVLVELGASGEAPSAIPAPAGAAEEPGAPADADAVLRAAVRAHGGPGGGLAVLAAAASLDMTYDRTVAVSTGKLVARHRVVRLGPAMRLEVQVLEGVGKDSVTVITPRGDAWIAAEGQTVARDLTRTREVLDRFTPEQLLALPLGLPEDIGTTTAWQGLVVASRGDSEFVLQPGPEAPADAGLLEARFAAEQGTLSRVSWSTEHGVMTFIYSDYRELRRGLVIPFQARIERAGAPIEELRVVELSLDSVLDPGLFEEPAAE